MPLTQEQLREADAQARGVGFIRPAQDPATMALDAAIGRPAWYDQSIPQQERLTDALLTYANVGAREDQPFATVQQQIQRHFPGADVSSAQQHYEQDRTLERARRAYSQADPDAPDLLRRHALSFAATYRRTEDTQNYADALRRFRAGNPQPQDYEQIAQYERRQAVEANYSPVQKIALAVLDVPAMIGEAYISGRLLSFGGQATGLTQLAGSATGGRAALYQAGHVAAQTAGMPSMYLPQAAENALEHGGHWLDLKNLAPAYAVGVINTAILGQVMSPSGGGIRGYLGRVAAGVGEQQVADIATRGLGLTTHYGALEELLEGKKDALMHATTQAITFAMFGALHAGTPGESILPNFRSAINYFSRQGMSREAVGRNVFQATQPIVHDLRQNGELSREGLMPRDLPEPLRRYVETVQELMTEGASAARERAQEGQGQARLEQPARQPGLSDLARAGQPEGVAPTQPVRVESPMTPAQASAALATEQAKGPSRNRVEPRTKPEAPSEGLMNLARGIGLNPKGTRAEVVERVKKAFGPAAEEMIRQAEAPVATPEAQQPPKTAPSSPPEAPGPQSPPEMAAATSTHAPGSPERMYEILRGQGVSHEVATQTVQTVMEDAARRQQTSPAKPREPFLGPLDVALDRMRAKLERQGFSKDRIEKAIAVAREEGLHAPDMVTGFHKAETREPTTLRAIEHVKKTGEPGVYVEMDLANLGGVNAKLGNSGANEFFRKVADIVREEMARLPADSHLFRHGGDELSAIVINGDKGAVTEAMRRAHARIKEAAQQFGLSDIEHPKHPGVKEKRGTGITFGVSEIGPKDSPKEVFSRADREVEARKKSVESPAGGKPDVPAAAPSVASESPAGSILHPDVIGAVVDAHAANLTETQLKRLKVVLTDPRSYEELARKVFGGVSKQAVEKMLNPLWEKLQASDPRLAPYETLDAFRKAQVGAERGATPDTEAGTKFEGITDKAAPEVANMYDVHDEVVGLVRAAGKAKLDPHEYIAEHSELIEQIGQEHLEELVSLVLEHSHDIATDARNHGLNEEAVRRAIVGELQKRQEAPGVPAPGQGSPPAGVGGEGEGATGLRRFGTKTGGTAEPSAATGGREAARDQLAEDIRQQHNEAVDEHNAMLDAAIKALERFGFDYKVFRRFPERFEDADSVRGLDEAAADLAREYGHILGRDPESRLFDLLTRGKQQAMTKAEARARAEEHFLTPEETGHVESMGQADGVEAETVRSDLAALEREARREAESTERTRPPEAAGEGDASESGARAADGGYDVGDFGGVEGMGAAGGGRDSSPPPAGAPGAAAPQSAGQRPTPPATGWFHNTLDWFKSFANQSFAALTRLSKTAGEKLAQVANATNIVKSSWDYYAKVLKFEGKSLEQTSPEENRYIGAVWLERRMRFDRDRLRTEAREASNRGVDLRDKARLESDPVEKKRLLAESKKAFGEADDLGREMRNVGTLVGQKDSPLPNETAFEEGTERLWSFWEGVKQEWTRQVEADFRKLKDLGEYDPIESKSQIPALPLNAIALRPEEVPTTPGAVGTGKGMAGLRIRAPGFTRHAELSAAAYDVDVVHMMKRTLEQGIPASRRAEFARAAIKDGVIVKVAGDTPPEGSYKFQQNGKYIATTDMPVPEGWKHEAARGLAENQAVLVQDKQVPEGFKYLGLEPGKGLPGLDPRASYYVHPDAYRDVVQGLGIGERPGQVVAVAKAVMDKVYSIALMSPVELATHMANHVTALFRPGMGTPLYNLKESFNNAWKIYTGDPEMYRKIAEVAKIAASFNHEARPGLLGERLQKYDPTAWLNKLTSGIIDTMQKAVRVQLADAYDKMQASGHFPKSETAKRDFINQALGNYSTQGSNRIVQFLKDTGLQSFAEAAHTFTIQGLKASFGGAVNSPATTWSKAVELRTIAALKLLPMMAMGPVLNSIFWGQAFPNNVPAFGIKTGEDKDKVHYFDPLSFTGIRRGARMTGLNALTEAAIHGDKTAGQTLDRAIRDARMSLVHLVDGPPAQFLHTLATGENALGHRVATQVSTANTPRGIAAAEQRGAPPAGSSQELQNLRAAALNVNPLIGAFTEADRPRTPRTLLENVYRSLGPFGEREAANRQMVPQQGQLPAVPLQIRSTPLLEQRQRRMGRQGLR